MMENGKEVLEIYHLSQLVGGAVLSIDETTGYNTVELLFISPKQEGKGLGTQVWKAIEQMYKI